MAKLLRVIASGCLLAGLLAAVPVRGDVVRYQLGYSPLRVGVLTYIHEYQLTFNPCTGTFEGTGSVFDGTRTILETIEGTYDATGIVAFKSTYDTGYWYAYHESDGPTMITDSAGGTYPAVISFLVMTHSEYKNHGDYVKTMGGGADAAHSCIGMPIRQQQ